MNLPSGLVFYLDFKYGTANAGRTTSESLFGGSTSGDFGRTDSAENGLYGNGRFGYSINEDSATVAVGAQTYASASHADVGFDGDLSASIEAGDIQKLTIAKSAISDTADDDAITSFILSGTDITGDVNYSQFNKVDGSNYIFFVKATGAVDANDVVVKFSHVPTDYAQR